MQKIILSLVITFALTALYSTSFAQQPVAIKQGPSGIFIFPGDDIPSGKSIGSYSIERSEDNTNWKTIAELKTPSTFDAFKKALDKSKVFFPTQPLPQGDKLSQLYNKAVNSGNTDSLKGMRLLFPIRVALGIMYYDTTASKHIAYRYRVNAVKAPGDIVYKSTSDTVSLPFKIKFDSITLSETSFNRNEVMVKWKSAGNNPAPLFSVYKFRFGAPVPARGSVSRYAMNDTAYYVYTETVQGSEAEREMQFFVSPYDHYGNSGQSSQIAIISRDNFNKAGFVKNHIAFKPKKSGIEVCWHFTDPVTVKTVEIFRSENEASGFRKLTEVPVSDTSYLDQQIWPEKSYYYYVQAVAKAGNRTKQSTVMMADVPAVTPVSVKIGPPVLRQVAVVNNHIRLLIEVNDTIATHVRVYRGVKDGLVALPTLLQTDGAAFVSFTDLTLKPGDRKDMVYAVRNEKPNVGISSLSAELPVTIHATPDDIAYFFAFSPKGNIELYWDDAVSENSNTASYTIARKNGPANSRSPQRILAENISSNSYIDRDAQAGNQYTYILSLHDKSGNSSEKTFKVTIPPEK